MTGLKLTTLAFLLLVLPLSAAHSADLVPIKVAVGLSLPPYVLEDEQRGMEFDIVREALENAGYEMVPVFLAFGDVPDALANGRAQAAMTVGSNAGIEAFLSDAHITYHNDAMTLQSSGIVIDGVDDIAGHSVMAFQDARVYLPQAYRDAVERSLAYMEIAEQFRQNLALINGEVEVVVADINIFNWYRNDPRVAADPNAAAAIAYHDIFPPTPYHVAFLDENARDAFNATLAAMRSSGRYQAIVDSYAGVQ